MKKEKIQPQPTPTILRNEASAYSIKLTKFVNFVTDSNFHIVYLAALFLDYFLRAIFFAQTFLENFAKSRFTFFQDKQQGIFSSPIKLLLRWI